MSAAGAVSATTRQMGPEYLEGLGQGRPSLALAKLDLEDVAKVFLCIFEQVAWAAGWEDSTGLPG